MDECIKREDVIEKLTGVFQLQAETAKAIVDSIPSTDVVERKMGKWKTAYLDHEAFGVRPHIFYCSKCQQITSFRTFFCPNCGAKMEES